MNVWIPREEITGYKYRWWEYRKFAENIELFISIEAWNKIRMTVIDKGRILEPYH